MQVVAVRAEVVSVNRLRRLGEALGLEREVDVDERGALVAWHRLEDALDPGLERREVGGLVVDRRST
jgi:hypothetical protein